MSITGCVIILHRAVAGDSQGSFGIQGPGDIRSAGPAFNCYCIGFCGNADQKQHQQQHKTRDKRIS